MVKIGSPGESRNKFWTEEEEAVLRQLLEEDEDASPDKIAKISMDGGLLPGRRYHQVRDKARTMVKSDLSGNAQRWSRQEVSDLVACVVAAKFMYEGIEDFRSIYPGRSTAACERKLRRMDMRLPLKPREETRGRSKGEGPLRWSPTEIKELLRMSKGNPVLTAVAKAYHEKHPERSEQAAYGKLFKLKSRPTVVDEWRLQDIGKHNLDLADQILCELDELAHQKREGVQC